MDRLAEMNCSASSRNRSGAYEAPTTTLPESHFSWLLGSAIEERGTMVVGVTLAEVAEEMVEAVFGGVTGGAGRAEAPFADRGG